MSAFIFTFPTTKLNVQHWPEDHEDISEDEYEALDCTSSTANQASF
jgi:hypothetical protein